MSREYGWDIVVQAFNLHFDGVVNHRLDGFVYLLVRHAARGVACQEVAALDPGQGDNLQRSLPGIDDVSMQPVTNIYIRDIQRGENFKRGRLCENLRSVVVADQQEYWNARVRQPCDAPGELALVRL